MKPSSLNHIYRVIWSHVLNAWVAVAENVKGRSKSSAGRSAKTGGISGLDNPARLMLKGTVAAVMMATGTLALAAPGGGQVVSGTGSITQNGSTTTINQSSQTLNLNWQNFNVASHETVNFVQPNASAVAVNRILDTNGSQILGHINANGQVWLINPNGILFGQGAQVNVGGLVASTLDITSNANGTLTLGGSGAGSVVNQGTINAANGGYVALVGNVVNNQGTITAPLGTIALGAGNAATLTLSGNSLLSLKIDQSTLNNLAANGGLIQADGGHIILTAGAANSLLASVVNNTGIVRAQTIQNQNGVITLLGGMKAGTTNVGGTLDASAPVGGNGGSIETSAAHVRVANDAHITTLAANGLTGSWLIDPVDFTIAATGGDMTGATLTSQLAGGNVIIQSSSGTSGTSGNINVNDAVSWSANTLTLTAANNINVNAVMTATGTASIVLNPATANGGSAAVTGGTINMGMSPAGTVNTSTGNAYTGQINISGTGTVTINNVVYTVINSLGAAADATTAPGTMTLQGMAATANLAGHYVLGSNIDATATSGWNAGAGFTPIGNSTTRFTGVFDGFGHTVGTLTINSMGAGVGLFGYGGASAIRNIGIAGGSITGMGVVGGLVGGGGCLYRHSQQ